MGCTLSVHGLVLWDVVFQIWLIEYLVLKASTVLLGVCSVNGKLKSLTHLIPTENYRIRRLNSPHTNLCHTLWIPGATFLDFCGQYKTDFSESCLFYSAAHSHIH